MGLGAQEISILVIAAIGLVVILGLSILYYIFKRHAISFRQALDLTGLPIITLEINNIKYHFVIDSGSNYSIICHTITSIKHNNDDLIPILFTINDKEYNHSFYYSKEDKRFQEFYNHTGIKLTGLLGSDFMTRYKYIIDYNKKEFKK